MRFSIWKKAVMLGVAALGSGGVLASGITERASVANPARDQAPSRAVAKRSGAGRRTDAVQTKADAAVPAAHSIETVPAVHVPAEGDVLPHPRKQEETAPAGSSVLPVALKVRG
jgi:hypothetical protein